MLMVPKQVLRSLFLILLFSAATVSAQRPGDMPDASPEAREKYRTEIRQYKHQFLAKELQLTREQQNAFFPVYDQMEDRMMKLNDETRELEKRVLDNPQASEPELQGAASAVFSQRLREGEIETEYFAKFQKILSNRQLLRLKNTERKFTRQLMKQHRRLHAEQADDPSRTPRGKRTQK